jgi:NADH-quinone oxidoreductase subunit E
MLTQKELQEIEAELEGYDHKRAGCVEVLKVVQRHRGWVSDENLHDLAQVLEMTPDELDGVATSYSLIFRRPVGRHVIYICDSVSCWIMGYRDLMVHLRERLGIWPGETSADGRFTLLPIPCLGTCDHAPALMIDEDLHQDLTAARLDQILEKYE